MFKQLICHKRSLVVGVLLFAVSGSVLALPGDRDHPITIDADSAERSEKTGVTSYIGSVELTQGSLNILADKIDIYTINGEVDHALATGQRAYFTQQQSIDKQPIKAWALTIKYALNDEIINLLGDARIEQNGSTVTSPEIDYYAEQELVKAKGGVQGSKDRVHVMLPAQNKSGATTAKGESTVLPTEASVSEGTGMAMTEDDIAAAIKPVIKALKPIIDAAVEEVNALPDNKNETP
jgi:lipopolysaccharide export system protein LptA|tara:strand:- start:25100 stop:25810 length:711 start_codon:yes stop_codon:yes gene_type:complete